jgi:hypothetical protein
MKLQFNRILLVQSLVLTTIGGFANTGHIAGNHITGINAIIPIKAPEDTSAAGKTNFVKTVLTERLVSFNADYMSHSIDLHWNVAGGNHFAHFYIERSFDGTTFEKVGDVNGNDETTAQDYSYIDYVKPAVARKNDIFYRLKQVDASQHADYSKMLIVRMYNTKSVTAVSVTPDPSVNDILVNVQLKENSFVAITVRDEKGSQIMKKTTHADLGANSFSLDGTSKLKPGSYMLEVIINSNERMTMQLIKS